MPSTRRVKITGLLLFASILIILYVTSGASQTRSSEFYTRTVSAMDARHKAQTQEAADLEAKSGVEELAKLRDDVVAGKEGGTGRAAPDSPLPGAGAKGGSSGEDQMPLADEVAGKAKEVKDAVKDAVHGVSAPDGEKSVAGRKMMKEGDKIVKDDGVAKVGNTGQKEAALKSEPGPDTKEDHEVELELNDILKKSPIIVFSKSYCPYSKKAKHILLDLYKIVPAPFVVELDTHPLGQRLQDALEKSTGRRTVPNVLINGKSIGGGDDVAALDSSRKLSETIRTMGGKRIMEANRIK